MKGIDYCDLQIALIYNGFRKHRSKVDEKRWNVCEKIWNPLRKFTILARGANKRLCVIIVVVFFLFFSFVAIWIFKASAVCWSIHNLSIFVFGQRCTMLNAKVCCQTKVLPMINERKNWHSSCGEYRRINKKSRFRTFVGTLFYFLRFKCDIINLVSFMYNTAHTETRKQC